MKRIIVHLEYTTLTIENLENIWIQPATLQPTWMLCYKDYKYEKGILYRCPNKYKLKKAGEKLLNAYVNGEKEVTI